MSRVKVALPVRWYGGGIRTYLMYWLAHADHTRYEFTILGTQKDIDEQVRDELGEAVTYVQISNKNSAIPIFFGVLSHLLRHKYDIVHSQGMGAAISCAIPARLTRIPHITTLHDALDENHFSGIKGKLQRFGVSALLRQLRLIHTISKDQQDRLLSNLPGLANNTEIKLVQSGVDTSRFAVDQKPRNLREELSLTPDHVLIGYLGRFMPVKGFPDLIDAVHLGATKGTLPATVRLICFGWGGYIREEQERIRSLEIDDYFMFLPHTDSVSAAIMGLDAVVMPSRSEALGLLAMETLIIGTPLIASTCIGLRSVITNTPAITFKPENPASLLEGIETFLHGKRDAGTEAQAFAATARSRFEISSLVQAKEKMYVTVLNRPKS